MHYVVFDILVDEVKEAVKTSLVETEDVGEFLGENIDDDEVSAAS